LLPNWLALSKHKMVCSCWCQPSSVPNSRWSIWPLSTHLQNSPCFFTIRWWYLSFLLVFLAAWVFLVAVDELISFRV
jgi:hypothetical protein